MRNEFNGGRKRSLIVQMMLMDKIDVKAVERLLDQGVPIEEGYSNTLVWSASKGYADVVRLLLDRGADVNAHDMSLGGSTALIAAAFAGHVEIARLLLEKGANVGATNIEGVTAIDLARKFSPESGIAQLIEQELGLEEFKPRRKKPAPKP